MRLNQEATDTGGDGGGAATAAAEPAAPAAEPTSPLSAPTEGKTLEAGDPAPAPSAPAQGGWQADSFLTKMYDPTTGELRSGWEEAAKESGMEHAVGYLGRDRLGGKLDETFKAMSHLATLTGKKVSEYTPEEAAALPSEQREALISSLMNRPAEASEYGMREMEPFKGQELPDETVDYWQSTFKEAGLTKEQAEIVGAKYNQWGEQMGAAQKEATEAQQAEADGQIAAHFRQEWGDDFHHNSDMVEQYIAKNLDPQNNPAHRAMIHDQAGLDMIYAKAKAQQASLQEGTMPNAPATTAGGGAEQQFDDFLAKHPAWQSDPDPKVREYGLNLAERAMKAAERRG